MRSPSNYVLLVNTQLSVTNNCLLKTQITFFAKLCRAEENYGLKNGIKFSEIAEFHSFQSFFLGSCPAIKTTGVLFDICKYLYRSFKVAKRVTKKVHIHF